MAVIRGAEMGTVRLREGESAAAFRAAAAAAKDANQARRLLSLAAIRVMA